MRFITSNGISFQFDNNYVVGTEVPLFVFDKEGNLLEVNFDGYRIEKINPLNGAKAHSTNL